MKNNSQMREEGGGIVQYTVIGDFKLPFTSVSKQVLL